MQGLIVNIQRYSLRDGDGIRTIVFFKGCPLHCPWCSNPESISFQTEQVKINSKCIQCRECSFDIDECPSGAITEFGQKMTVDEIVKEILKDQVFYQTSGGGVTLSGGEVLAQASFAIQLLRKINSLGIHTAIETSGQGKTEDLIELARYTDLFLFDLKIMDQQQAKTMIGADQKLIKKNLQTLVELNQRVIPRIPLIPGFTMDEENITAIIHFVLSLGLQEIHILPFHQYGSNKYTFLNQEYQLQDTATPSDQLVDEIKVEMEQAGLQVTIGG